MIERTWLKSVIFVQQKLGAGEVIDIIRRRYQSEGRVVTIVADASDA
jgi:hypothetical protein